MIGVKPINAAWIADIVAELKTPLGLKTIEAHSSQYDDKLLNELMPLAPAILIRYGYLRPVEFAANGGSSLNKQVFTITFIAESLLGTQDASNGCYDMLDAFRNRYNGGTLTVPDEGLIHLKLEEEGIVQSGDGLSVYFAIYSFEQD